VTFAEGEQVLSTTSGIADIQIQKAAVVKSDKRYRRGEGAACVQALIHRIAALFQCEDTDV
jgi:hypothetical protein